LTVRTVAVIGASGRQGGAQVRKLLEAGFAVRAISRSADPFGGESMPVHARVIAADLYDEASLVPAFDGAEAVFHNHPMRVRRDRPLLAANVGRAALKAGVRRVVWNVSGWIPDRPGDPNMYGNNTAAINALWRTGAGATAFGSVLFMDNLLTNWARPFIVNEGRYVYPHNPNLAANWISLDDVARIMIHSIDRPDMEGAWMNIGGPERLKGPQVAAALSAALGREIRFDPCTPDEFGRYLAGAYGNAMTEDEKAHLAQQVADFYRYNNTAPTRPFEVNAEALRERIPIELETMSNWARRQNWYDSCSPRPPAG
jgi:uncharacterized protein YbjT (DUF2867 family)